MTLKQINAEISYGKLSTETYSDDKNKNQLLSSLNNRALVFVGLMGAGKSVIGKRVATMLHLPFYDSDNEIEKASKMTITELFKTYGESEFRALEQRVIFNLIKKVLLF